MSKENLEDWVCNCGDIESGLYEIERELYFLIGVLNYREREYSRGLDFEKVSCYKMMGVLEDIKKIIYKDKENS